MKVILKFPESSRKISWKFQDSSIKVPGMLQESFSKIPWKFYKDGKFQVILRAFLNWAAPTHLPHLPHVMSKGQLVPFVTPPATQYSRQVNILVMTWWSTKRQTQRQIPSERRPSSKHSSERSKTWYWILLFSRWQLRRRHLSVVLVSTTLLLLAFAGPYIVTEMGF